MVQKIFFLIAILFVTTFSFGYAQIVDEPYEVATWHGFRKTAINFTFDDGTSDHFTQVIPLFNEYDLKITLNAVTNWVGSWADFQDAAAQGHEVASHTVTHPHFPQITLDVQNNELKNSKQIIETQIPDKKCLTLAYAYCEKGQDTLCSKYYIAARGCQGYMEPKTPANFYNVSSMICGTLGINTFKNFKTRFETAAKDGSWCVFLIHATNGTSYSPLSIDTLRKSVAYLGVRQSKFWVTTFKNAALYARERNAVTVTEVLNTDTLISLSVTDTLVDSIFSYPLTIRRPLPENWPSANVTQDSVPVSARIVQVDTTVYLMFDVIPDGGDVVLKKNDTLVIPEIDTLPVDPDTIYSAIRKIEAIDINDIIQIFKEDNNLVLTVKSTINAELVISLVDLTGRTIVTKRVYPGRDGFATVNIPIQRVNKDVCIVKVTDGTNTWTKLVSLV